MDEAPLVWGVSSSMTLGRDPECEVRVDDPRVSRTHARLQAADGKIRIRDLHSRHGTYLNGERLRDADVVAERGALLRCGSTLLLIVDDSESYRVAPQRLSRTFLRARRGAWAGPTLWRVWQQATRIAALKQPVLILGESGAGKEAIARLIHGGTPSEQPFVALNVAAIPAELFESELFGHVRGAFTGATSTRLGAFREAGRGTLFLDEIAELRLDLQVKLLRALEDARVRPVGSSTDFPVEARVLTATNRDLDEAVTAGRFRAELYFRIAGLVLEVPPLRERRDEILLLAAAFLAEECAGLELDPDAAEAIALGAWKGNARELQHAMGRAAAQATAQGSRLVLLEHLPDQREPAARDGKLTVRSVSLALARVNGNASRAAKLLSVSRATLYNFCERHGLSMSSLRAELSTAPARDRK